MPQKPTFPDDILEHMGVLLVQKDRNGAYLQVNCAWEEATGLNRSTVIGKTDVDLFPAETAEKTRKNDLLAIASGTITEMEDCLETRTGTRCYTSKRFPSGDESATSLSVAMIDITDRRRAEKALEESEKRFNTWFNNTQVSLFKRTLDGKMLELNPRYAQNTGYATVEECIADFNPRQRWVEPEALEKFQRLLKENGAVTDYEARTFSREEKEQWVLMSAALFPEEGTIIGSVIDITDRKRAELALQNSEIMQRKLLANIGDVIVIIDREDINRYKSPNIERMFGWKPEDLVGANTWDNVHPEDLASAKEFLEALKQEPGAVRTMELRYRCKGGEYRWIEFTGSNLLDDPDIQGILGNYHDIMGRREAEQKLRDSEARFKALHNASFGGITIHDKGIILDCNQGLSEISGFSIEELIGMDGLLLIAEQTRELVRKNIQAGYEKPYEAFGVRKDGTEYPIRLEARSIPYKGKNVRAVEFRDLTEIKRAEEDRKKLQDQLTQAQKMETVGRLAGGVAHDYNNMLSIILGYTDLALADMAPSDPLYANLTQIQGAAQRSADITRQLLAFARKQPIAPKVVDINAIIEGMFTMLRRLIGEDIDITWHPGKKIAPVKVDPSQIEQILINLCVNARDAIAGSGKIIIETRMISFEETQRTDLEGYLPGKFVMLTVGDTGYGMDRETLEHIFEPFFTTKGVAQGTGLGLATVYGIVQQNNGFIKVYSEPGQGTTFRIYLPRHQGEPAQTEPAPVSAIPLGGGETVLLVEDEPAINKMCQTILEKLGYQVLSAPTPEDALHLADARGGEIDLLLTDVVMPGMNGRELTLRLRTAYPEMKVLFMSGYTADVIAHQGILEEEVQFIQKPFSIRDLGPKIREALKKAPPPV